MERIHSLLALNATDNPMNLNFVTKGKRTNYKVKESTSDSEIWDLGYTNSPLTIEFPKYITDAAPAQILLTGLPGKIYGLLTQDSGNKSYVYEVTLDSNGTGIITFNGATITSAIVGLVAVYELNSARNVVGKITYRNTLNSTTTDINSIYLSRYQTTQSQNPVLFGTAIADVLLTAINGSNCVNCYQPQQNMTYGILETGEVVPSSQEVATYLQIRGN